MIPFGEILGSLGYLGIFGISFLGGLLVFVPLPYILLIVVAALSGQFDPFLIVLSSTGGASLGKLAVFQACYSGQAIVSEKTKTNLESFRMLFSKYAWLAVFVAAATPVPDDVVNIPLGLARYSRIRFLLATLIGKSILFSLVVLGANSVGSGLLDFLVGGEGEAGGQSNFVGLLVIGAAVGVFTLAVTYLVTKTNWQKWIGRLLLRQMNE